MRTRPLLALVATVCLAIAVLGGVLIHDRVGGLVARQDEIAEILEELPESEVTPAVEAARLRLRRSAAVTEILADRLLQIAAIGAPVLAAGLAGVLFAWVFRPLRRAERAGTPGEAAAAVAGLSAELANLLRDLDAERQARVLDLLRAGHLAALGTLSAAVAHEVRNPLMAIVTLAETARRKLDADSPVELDRIEEEATRAGKLLGEMLSLAPRDPDPDERFDLVPEIQAAVELARARSRIPEGVVSTALPPAAYREGRPSRWRQLVFILVSNAIDAVARGGSVRVSLGVDFGEWRLTVEDDGCGLAADIRGRLFAPFFTTKGGAGVGLGLFIADGLVRELAGTIEVESDGPGRGSRFIVRIPGE